MRKSLANATVLVVDDEVSSLEMVTRVLTRLSVADVLKAKDGVEALERLEQAGGAVDASIIDFNMPRLHGLQLLKKIRTGETAAPAGLPCIMLTGYEDPRLCGFASALGVDAFLQKPATFETLKTELDRIIGEKAIIAAPDVYRRIDVDAPVDTILDKVADTFRRGA